MPFLLVGLLLSVGLWLLFSRDSFHLGTSFSQWMKVEGAWGVILTGIYNFGAIGLTIASYADRVRELIDTEYGATLLLITIPVYCVAAAYCSAWIAFMLRRILSKRKRYRA